MVDEYVNKVSANLLIKVVGEFDDYEVTEETIRYLVEQDLEEAGWSEVYVNTVPSAKWIVNIYKYDMERFECSACYKTNNRATTYCPNCGRRMKEI